MHAVMFNFGEQVSTKNETKGVYMGEITELWWDVNVNFQETFGKITRRVLKSLTSITQ